MPYSQHLNELEDAVCDEASFLEFLHTLAAEALDDEAKEADNPSNPYGPSHNGWENRTIGSFIEAAHAWAQSSVDGLPLMSKEENPWRRVAQILHAGKVYE